MPTITFTKLIDTNYHEHFVNINMILDIDEKNRSISTSLTSEFVNGEIYLTKASTAHLLSNIDWV